MSDLETEDKKFLAALALALVDQPRASLLELARAIGVSKATLYRFCRTREQLIERLMNHCTHVFSEAISTAELDTAPVPEAFRRLTANNLEHRELTAFLTYYWKDALKDPGVEAGWDTALDTFFLRGQQEGVFRIDIPAPALTEIWVSMVIGLVDAERRGRVARAGLAALLERAFLQGAGAH
ncbi:TetR/AcrR family transcriptional regulator [Thauera linaloolentis]|uniref:TetR family transcriptional regulator n=1 Tax=Thauera linaloolentis (strain DSM 12138 / JCM 21573 / CCUG 41526 / CIP 105981 / IAM 15112 / NBRC 102519 / 47Lol) TaxID=1123367 RepID=N6ZCC5_THAL4|nr:TetR/AcrR family transcriptional regulator [Thauera linaloolentis]ENO89819.1 TetR family transcriptional regulator [Thauera linaloolentis 47Lol = DSM 12138]MCM8566992.1 TetR/AcrR family transcriptional regulator [Thauera linaloolentis]